VTLDANRVATIAYARGRGPRTVTFLATDPAGKSGYAAPLLVVRGVDNRRGGHRESLRHSHDEHWHGFFELKGTADDPDAVDAVAYRIGLYDAAGLEWPT